MNEKIIEKIEFSKWWRGVRRNHRGQGQKLYLHSFDTETWEGRVFLCGFYDQKGFLYAYGLKKNYADILFRWSKRFFSGKGKNFCHVVAAHNLKYDLGVILWPLLNPLGKIYPAPKTSKFCYLPIKADILISWRRPCFMKVKFRGGRDVVTFVDTFAFFNTSLKKILQTIGGDVQKLETPPDIGKRVIPVKEILPYNKEDCRGVYRILEFLEEKHKEFDVRFSISLPQMASRIFRHKFLNENFVTPPKEAIWAGLYSYHGGKNTWNGKQGWVTAWDLDIKSAFPHAMMNLPNFSRGTWRRVRARTNFAGFYLIEGTLSACPWGVVFSHNFKKLGGKVSGIWTTGYELEEAIRSREIKNFRILDGWVFEPENVRDISPFVPFIEHFFKAKESAKTKIEREFYKTTLNSLYGKFIQKTEDEFTGKFKTGGLFDSTVGSLITGFVRAKIHFLEHKYNALHTATDGIITTKKPDPSDLGSEAGFLTIKNYGPCLILRNKLYLHYDEKGTLKNRGLHGFQGKPDDLIKMWKEKSKYYKINRLTSWAESWGMKIPPGGPLSRDMVLNCIEGGKNDRLK